MSILKGIGCEASILQKRAEVVTNPGPPGWTSRGCYTDQAPRTLTTGMAVPGGPSAMTVALCTTACKSRNFLYAGLEYAQVGTLRSLPEMILPFCRIRLDMSLSSRDLPYGIMLTPTSAKECWCGNAIQNGGVPALSGCNRPCKGDGTEYCGGSNRLNLYQFGPISSSTTSVTTLVTTISSSTITIVTTSTSSSM